MEKEFIPYEQALALKELGFDEDCFSCYTEKKEVIVRVGDYRSFSNNNSEDTIIRDFNSYENGTVSAPTFSQAFRFFREKYGYDVTIKKCTPSEYKFEIEQLFVEGDNYYFIDFVFKTYEEAEVACLRKLIEIVKRK